MENDALLKWAEIKELLKSRVGEDMHEHWFRYVEPGKLDSEVLVLRVPNQIYQVWIDSNYMQDLQWALTEVLDGSRRIEYEFDPNLTKSDHRRADDPAQKERNEKNTHISTSSESNQNGESGNQMGLDLQGGTERNGGFRHADGISGVGSEKKSANGACLEVNTFRNFVVGPNNQFAYSACLAAADRPASGYNPIFIYGRVGTGKTHLMHAIGNQLKENKPHLRAVYSTGENFTNEFITAIQKNRLEAFRRKYRKSDVLLVDDIQFFGGKERTKEELFHTFDALFTGEKQIVLTSDRPASEISQLEARLVSRFEWGLTAELQPPDVETRLAILRRKQENLGTKIPGEILTFLAERIRSNVRRLEGAFMRIGSYASLSGQALTLEIVEGLLRDILTEEVKQVITIQKIQELVSTHFELRIADMASRRRPNHIAWPRQIAMFLCRELTKASLAEIGEAFGGRDHGTVIYACRTVRGKADQDEQIKQIIRSLTIRLNS